MKKMISVFLILAMLVCVCAVPALAEEASGEAAQTEDETRKVICVGDSITAAGYPESLQSLLGDGWEVGNFGQPGTRMMSGARFSYMDQENYEDSLNAGADYYILMLGSNDSMTGDEWDPELFHEDYSRFLESYIEVAGETNVYVMIPPCVYQDGNPRALSSRVDLDLLENQICPMIRDMAEQAGVTTIDLHTFTADHPEWFDDGLHPNQEGNDAIAGYIYETVFE